MENITITTDLIALKTTIEYFGANPILINELDLLLREISTISKNVTTKYVTTWSNLRPNIIQFSTILKKEKVNTVFDERTKELIKQYLDDRRSIDAGIIAIDLDEYQISEILKTNNFSRSLKSHQIRNIIKLLNNKHGANFSVPGAGKTTTLLALHTILRHLNIVDKLFIIAPINAFISWETEKDEIFESNKYSSKRLSIRDIENFHNVTTNNIPDIMLVNYEKLRGDVSSLMPYFNKNKVHLVLDESHRIKGGVDNLSYKQILDFAYISKRRDVMSGTPMPQSYKDIEPQFNILWPNKIIPNLESINDDSEKIRILNESIKNKFVRTTKKELDLTPPKIIFNYVEMGPIQSEIYRLCVNETARIISGMTSANRNDFRKIGNCVIKLLQVATNPMLLGTSDEYYDKEHSNTDDVKVWELIGEFTKYEHPAKITFLMSRVKEILNDADKKVVIWTYFVRNIKVLERLLTEYNPVTIYGAIPTGSDADEEVREGRLKKFHFDKDCRVLIVNPQAGGEGISLHRVCHDAIYLDRNFNAAYYLQSIDRIHRLGLPKEVDTNIELIIAKNSIDEIVLSRLNHKIENLAALLDDAYLSRLAYDPSDIIDEENSFDISDFVEIKNHIFQKS